MEKLIDLLIQKRKKQYYPYLAFLITFLLTLLYFYYAGFFSSGEKSILVSDLYGQYYDFLIAFKKMLQNGDSFLFSWNIGMGTNILGWFAYYVASPLNLLLLLVPMRFFLLGITLLIVIKLSLAALSFSFYLKKVVKIDGIEVVLFALYYAMCGYAITYYFTLMWLDGLILLPIIVIQMKKLVDEKKIIGFIISLLVLFVTNYYIAYMVGVGCFFFFCAYLFYKKDEMGNKERILHVVRFISSAILAALMAAALLVPVFLQMVQMKSGETTNINWLSLNFNPFNFYYNTFAGSYTTLQEGKPLVYTGILTLILLPLYFMNTKIRKRERKTMFFLLALLVIIMCIPITDLFMHVGMEPTWFLYRYSFLVSFVVATIGCKQFYHMRQSENTEKKKETVIYLIVVMNLAFLLLYQIVDFNWMKLICNAFILIGFGLVFYGLEKKKLQVKEFYFVLLLLISIELVANGYITVYRIDEDLGYSNTEEILKEQDLTDQALKQLGEDNKDFYRVEKNYKATLNDSISSGYHGIANFCSVHNPNLNRFLWNMGLWVVNWRVEYSGSTEVTDSILNVKYRFHNNKKSKFQFSSRKEKGEFYIEENPYYLPIGFMVDQDLSFTTFEEANATNVFANQNTVMNRMLGTEQIDYYKKLEPKNIALENVTREIKNGFVLYQKIDKNKPASITYQVEADQVNNSYYYYFKYDNTGKKRKEVLISTPFAQEFESRFVEFRSGEVPFIVPISNKAYHKQGDLLTLTIDMKEEDQFKLEEELFCYLDMEQFKTFYQELNQNILKVTEYGDTSLKGTIEVKDRRLLYTSIPYEEGWTVTVDGKKTDTIPLFDKALIGVWLEEGTHELEFHYIPYGLKIGSILTILGLFVFFTLAFYSLRTKHSNNNKENLCKSIEISDL